MKKLQILAIFIILLLHGCDNASAISQERFNLSILNQNPVFTIDFHGAGTRYQLYLNGVLVEGNSNGVQSTLKSL